MKKTEYIYPGSDLDRARNLLAVLGTFWSKTYAATDQLNSYTTATAFAVAQTHRNLLEVFAAISHYDVPVFHEELLVPIVIRKSQLNAGQINEARFDRTQPRINGGLKFNTPVNDDLFSFPAPTALHNVRQVFNKITFPTAVMLNGVDFVVDSSSHAIRFTSNPFTNDNFIRKPLTSDGTTDEEITLWGFCGEFDYNYVFQQFAYVIGLQLKSSDGYKKLTSAIVSALVNGGATAKDLDTAVAAICGIPLTVEPLEVVERVFTDSRGVCVVTDAHVYRFNSNAEVMVAPEMRVKAGAQLVRCFEVREFFTLPPPYGPDEDQNQILPTTQTTAKLATQIFEPLVAENDDNIIVTENTTNIRNDLLGLAVDAGFLAACFLGDLVFENKQVPLEVFPNHPSGYTYVQFSLGGFPADVARFFDEVHARGIEFATAAINPCATNNRRLGTLAHILDRRAQPLSEPTAGDLPTTINPMRFLIENVLRNNVFVVRIVVSALDQNALNNNVLRHLRQLIPPQTAMIVVFELTGETEEINGDIMIDEQTYKYDAAAPISDTIDDAYVVDEGVFTRILSGSCQ
jgi:hypothetical protein